MFPEAPDPRDDVSLLADFASGDEGAFASLLARHGPAIKGYAARMLQSPQQAEEVYVETFLRVATSRGAWEPRGTVRSWLFTIAHRLCLDVLRRRKTARDAVPHLVELGWGPPAPSPEARALLRERAEELEEALARLPEEHREVLLLRVVHGLSAAEVGRALGRSEAQVNSEVSYARKRLRALLGDQDEAAPLARRGEAR